MAELPKCEELQKTVNSSDWNVMFIHRCRREINEDLRFSREINALCAWLTDIVDERERFVDELDRLVGRLVPERIVEFMKEVQGNDMPNRLKLLILSREFELQAREKDIFIQKLKAELVATAVPTSLRLKFLNLIAYSRSSISTFLKYLSLAVGVLKVGAFRVVSSWMKSISSDIPASSTMTVYSGEVVTQELSCSFYASGSPISPLPMSRSHLANCSERRFSSTVSPDHRSRIFSFSVKTLKDSSVNTKGSLKREWVVRPAGRSRDTIPNEATTKTIFPWDQSELIIVFQRNVFPIALIFAGMSSPIASQYFIYSLSGSATSQYIRISEKRILSSLDVAELVDSSSVVSHSFSSPSRPEASHAAR
nr:hypothetical protein [Tanacetum cinerariifolium]